MGRGGLAGVSRTGREWIVDFWKPLYCINNPYLTAAGDREGPGRADLYLFEGKAAGIRVLVVGGFPRGMVRSGSHVLQGKVGEPQDRGQEGARACGCARLELGRGGALFFKLLATYPTMHATGTLDRRRRQVSLYLRSPVPGSAAGGPPDARG